MQNKPMISFITPNYNDGETIERQIASIADQDYKYVEQIVVDDGSTDGSKELLKKLEKKYKNLKVVFLPKNMGACYARNEGAKLAQGKYLSFLPADAKLYPGVARIWVEVLEENPEFSFLYGGYKFTEDAKNNYREIFNYLGDAFDPYFLKVTNYIDGSFPIKKELFDKMGGWDVQIKSLQDWDFWLNAVVKHGAKGIYRREVFFETTYPHPGGLSHDSSQNWIARTEQIKKKYGIEPKKICVTGQGAQFHAKNIAKLLDADYLDIPSFKPHKYEMIYIVGFFGNIAQSLSGTRAFRVLHWIGSDILALQQAEPKLRSEVVRWIDNNIDVNLCEIEATRKELDALGIKARIVPFPPAKMYEPMELPKDFSVAVYMPYQNKAFYQPDLLLDIAKKMKKINFKFFGDVTMAGKKGNIEHWGKVEGAEKDKLIKETSCILRVTPHDGLPLSVIEWITAGRNAITTIDIPHSVKTGMKKIEIIDALRKAQTKGINKSGSKYYRELCDVKKFKDTIYGLMEVDMAYWWKKICPIWHLMEENQETTDDVSKVLTAVRELKPKSLLDLGCGTGRWSELLNVDNYVGIDFAKDLIKEAAKKYPNRKFEATDILNYDGKDFDVVFSFATLLHIKPKDLDKYVDKIKKMGKIGVFVEPILEGEVVGDTRVVFPKVLEMQKEDPKFLFNVKYTWIHDYMSVFNVKKVVHLSHNRNMFIVDLTK